MFITITTVIALVLMGILIFAVVYWVAVILRVTKGNRLQARVSEGLAARPPGEWGRLSVVIPAHNEERVIEQSVRSLRAKDYPDLEIVFVLDRCTDRTAELLAPHAAEDDRIVIVTNESCPDDWAGKCNAAWQGAKRATGEWLLFTDADVVFEPRLCRGAVGLASAQCAGLLSLLTTLTCRHYHEYVAQPVAAFILMHMYPAVRMNRHRTPRPFANGQFMLFHREWYERIGGHSGVKDELLEDLAFARSVVGAGGNLVVARDDGMCHCAMYDSLAAFEQGWKRIYIEAIKRKPRDLRRYARRVRALAAQPLLALLAFTVGIALILQGDVDGGIALSVFSVITVLVQGYALTLIYPPAGAPIWGIPLFPIGAHIVARILGAAATDLEEGRSIQWGGREYVFEPRTTGERRRSFTLQKPAPLGAQPDSS